MNEIVDISKHELYINDYYFKNKNALSEFLNVPKLMNLITNEKLTTITVFSSLQLLGIERQNYSPYKKNGQKIVDQRIAPSCVFIESLPNFW